MLAPRLQRHGLAISVHRFGVVAESFDAFGDLDECAETGHPQDFSVHHITYVMLREEGLPHIGLKLLHAQ
jgi:hypothetical protein